MYQSLAPARLIILPFFLFQALKRTCLVAGRKARFE
nr:MAG TPA: hypothetical protein [Caudoviricetes sp.]